MLEVCRVRSVEWKPTAVVALSTSIDQTQVAVAREDASIEIWIVAPGSVGWHCQLTIPGRDDCIISSLLWCFSSSCPAGRLFSASLDGSIIEWDLWSLQERARVSVIGGSIWQLSAEPLRQHHDLKAESFQNKDDEENGSSSLNDGSDSEDEDGDMERAAKSKLDSYSQRVAIGCDDGAVCIYVVNDAVEGMEYYRSFPRIKGKVLSVAWGIEAKTIFAGSSDGCIRCWDVATSHELYRITAGNGGCGTDSDLCIWSLLVLRDGTLVSGNSASSTQFWDSNQGTLLQEHIYHKGDVLALSATPNHEGVFSAGSDGQVVYYKCSQSDVAKLDLQGSGFTMRDWIFAGKNRVHTHDVRALTVAVPLVSETGKVLQNSSRKDLGFKRQQGMDYQKWALPDIPMLISGGEDAKLFAYPANNFLDFHPHDICPAPQRVAVQLVRKPKNVTCPIMISQHSTWIEVSMIQLKGMDAELGKRKLRDFVDVKNFTRSKKKKAMGYDAQAKYLEHSRGSNGVIKGIHISAGNLAKPMIRIECKHSQRIICSALSESGQFLAFSDRRKPVLYEIKLKKADKNEGEEYECKGKRRRLPDHLPPAHSMVFSPDSSKLIIAGNNGKIHVIDVATFEELHTFDLSCTDSLEEKIVRPPVTRLCTSSDGQWLATINCFGDIDVFNLEIFRQHWSITRLDGASITAAGFHPSNKNVLVVVTSSNRVYGWDVEAKLLGEWSKNYASCLPKRFLEFPGGIIGLTFPPSPEKTSVIVYSSRAMCLIDFGKPLKQGHGLVMTGKALLDSAKSIANGNGKHVQKKKLPDQNFMIKPFEHPVLFLTHLSDHSLLVLEKPWVDVIRNFRAPVYRHIYGT